MVAPETIPDGRYTNLYCPECLAHPETIDRTTDREGYRLLRCGYCLVSLKATIGGEYVPTATAPGESFDERLFETDD